MKSLIVEHLEGLNPKNTNLKKTVESLLQMGNIDGRLEYVIESIRLANTDKEKNIDATVTYLTNKKKMKDLGLYGLLTEAKSTKLFENNGEFSHEVCNIADKIENGLPQHAVLDAVSDLFKKFAWNKSIGNLSKKTDDIASENMAHKIVADAILALSLDKEASMYSDIIKKLDTAFHLPASQVKNYVYSVIAGLIDIHPAVKYMIDRLNIMEPGTQNAFSATSNINGKYVVTKRYSPTTNVGNNTIFMLNNKLYANGIDGVSVLEDLTILPQWFLKLCECFSKFNETNGCFEISDGIYDISVSNDNGQPVVKLDGIKQDAAIGDIMDTFAYIGINSQIIDCVLTLANNIGNITTFSNIITLTSEDVVLDIIKHPKMKCVNIFDKYEHINSLFCGTPQYIKELVKKDYAIDIEQYLGESKVNESINAPASEDDIEAEKELKELEQQLLDVMENIEKIENLDKVVYDNDMDVQQLHAELMTTQKELEEKISASRKELGVADDTTDPVAVKEHLSKNGFFYLDVEKIGKDTIISANHPLNEKTIVAIQELGYKLLKKSPVSYKIDESELPTNNVVGEYLPVIYNNISGMNISSGHLTWDKAYAVAIDRVNTNDPDDIYIGVMPVGIDDGTKYNAILKLDPKFYGVYDSIAFASNKHKQSWLDNAEKYLSTNSPQIYTTTSKIGNPGSLIPKDTITNQEQLRELVGYQKMSEVRAKFDIDRWFNAGGKIIVYQNNLVDFVDNMGGIATGEDVALLKPMLSGWLGYTEQQIGGEISFNGLSVGKKYRYKCGDIESVVTYLGCNEVDLDNICKFANPSGEVFNVVDSEIPNCITNLPNNMDDKIVESIISTVKKNGKTTKAAVLEMLKKHTNGVSNELWAKVTESLTNANMLIK